MKHRQKFLMTRGKAESVSELLSRYFDIHDALDQAEYVLSINDADDVREWVIDALGLEESNIDRSKMNDFLSDLFLIKEGVSQPPPRAEAPVKLTSKPQPKQLVVSTTPPPAVVAPLVVFKSMTIPDSRKSLREKCSCLAKTELGGHPLIGNCLSCGRIVCDAEDYGDCLSCGARKSTIHWLEVSQGNTDSNAEEAIIHKDRLVQYDREGTRRTRIYDDSTDWFAESSDIWKGKAEREEALRKARDFEEQKRQARLGMKVEIDFETGQVRVKDKAELIQAVEDRRDAALDEWVGGDVIRAQEIKAGNVLEADSQELLDLMREKLGRPRKTLLELNPSYSSIFDDW